MKQCRRRVIFKIVHMPANGTKVIASCEHQQMGSFPRKGRNAYIIKFPVCAIENVALALKCMAN